MRDSIGNIININDNVKHRFRPNYSIGKVVKIEDGCNAVCWVDFGEKVLNKKHLTICIQKDIIKQRTQ